MCVYFVGTKDPGIIKDVKWQVLQSPGARTGNTNWHLRQGPLKDRVEWILNIIDFHLNLLLIIHYRGVCINKISWSCSLKICAFYYIYHSYHSKENLKKKKKNESSPLGSGDIAQRSLLESLYIFEVSYSILWIFVSLSITYPLCLLVLK